jgi:hypothetical protein
MNKQYVNIGTPEDHLIEECAELIKSIMKARRFGYFNHPPQIHVNRFNNLELIRQEMDDVVEAMAKYEKSLMMLSYEFHKEKIKLDKQSEKE